MSKPTPFLTDAPNNKFDEQFYKNLKKHLIIKDKAIFVSPRYTFDTGVVVFWDLPEDKVRPYFEELRAAEVSGKTYGVNWPFQEKILYMGYFWGPEHRGQPEVTLSTHYNSHDADVPFAGSTGTMTVVPQKLAKMFNTIAAERPKKAEKLSSNG